MRFAFISLILDNLSADFSRRRQLITPRNTLLNFTLRSVTAEFKHVFNCPCLPYSLLTRRVSALLSQAGQSILTADSFHLSGPENLPAKPEDLSFNALPAGVLLLIMRGIPVISGSFRKPASPHSFFLHETGGREEYSAAGIDGGGLVGKSDRASLRHRLNRVSPDNASRLTASR